jgi:hypothetical protein
MTLFQPPAAYSKSIERPACPSCKTAMMLARIDMDAPDHDKCTFYCPGCENELSVVVK